MPTTKKRITITLSDEMDFALIKLAKRDAMPAATKATELIKQALEIEEDYCLDKIASRRAHKKNAKFYSHEEAWV